jgi:hypothetical protein
MITNQTGTRRYKPGFPPFVKLPVPEEIDNPIEIVHDLAVGLADSYRAGAATIVVPTK